MPAAAIATPMRIKPLPAVQRIAAVSGKAKGSGSAFRTSPRIRPPSRGVAAASRRLQLRCHDPVGWQGPWEFLLLARPCTEGQDWRRSDNLGVILGIDNLGVNSRAC